MTWSFTLSGKPLEVIGKLPRVVEAAQHGMPEQSAKNIQTVADAIAEAVASVSPEHHVEAEASGELQHSISLTIQFTPPTPEAGAIDG